MFDSGFIEERKPRLWAWFLSGVAVYLFILVNVFLSFVLGHISNRAASILAPGLMLLMSSHVNPFLGFFGGISLNLLAALFFGGLGLALRRSLQIFQLLQ
jgi:hypothetical protein